MHWLRVLSLFCVLHLWVFRTSDILAQDQLSRDAQEKLFENSIRPILVERCVQCHGPSKSESSLRLDREEFLQQGGDSGAVIVLGKADSSLLIQAIDYQHDVRMPPDKPLDQVAVAAFKQWINAGAYWPKNIKLSTLPDLRSGPATDQERTFWSLQPLKNSVATWRTAEASTSGFKDNSELLTASRTIDLEIRHRLDELTLVPNSRADKRTLIRRLSFDLTGLPPTPTQVEEFVQDKIPEAYLKLVEQLLNSTAYGERWGRHWLDVVRYADTAGETADYPVPDAWKYRNYVITSFNDDKPYHQFLREQIAGDLLAQNCQDPVLARQLTTATGYLAIARRFGFDIENYHHLTIQDAIDTLSQSTLGLSFGCARCHDHKFDPVSMEDYYALYGILESTLFPLSGSEQKQKTRSLVSAEMSESSPMIAALRDKLLAARVESLRKLGRSAPPSVLSILTGLDGDFEIQSPAAGGSRGVLVAPWLHEGNIAVTNAAQSPFRDLFPAGKVGIALPASSPSAAQAPSKIWQALRQNRFNPSEQSFELNFDFRVTEPTNVNVTTGTDPERVYQIMLTGRDSQSLLSLVFGNRDLIVSYRNKRTSLGAWESGKWYRCNLRCDSKEKILSANLTQYDGRTNSTEWKLLELPDDTIDQLMIGDFSTTSTQPETSASNSNQLPVVELDNLQLIPQLAASTAKYNEIQAKYAAEIAQLAQTPDLAPLQAELKQLVGIDGDFELQNVNSPPSSPWGPGPNSVAKILSRSQSPFENYYASGELGVYLPNRAEYDGFGSQLDRQMPNGDGQILATFDFQCAEQQAGGNGSWRYYLGHGPGNSAAIELFFNGSQFFRKSAAMVDPICEIKAGHWYQVSVALDVGAKKYSGTLTSTDSNVAFSGDVTTGWDGMIDYTFIDSYGHLPGVRPALDADNFTLGISHASFDAPPVDPAQAQVERQRRAVRINEIREQLAKWKTRADEIEQQLLQPAEDLVYAVVDGTPHDVAMQIRGEPSQPGKLVARRMPELFATRESRRITSGSGRLELAQWLTEDAKPLVARVIVNRVWQQHFGRGLVRTENDFGTRGEKPTHPELLDWLCLKFIENGWSLKYLHRVMVLSETYQQSSEPNADAMHLDPENKTLWRFSPRRLSAEEIRDAILMVSGELNRDVGRQHPFPAPHTWGFTQHAPFYAVYETDRRSIYLMQQRLKRHPFLALFDGSDPNASTARRELTIVPTQALYLMNNAFVHQAAERVVASIRKELNATNDSGLADSQTLRDLSMVQQLFRLTLSRDPSEAEVDRSIQFVSQYVNSLLAENTQSPESARIAGQQALARTLLTRNEFLFVD